MPTTAASPYGVPDAAAYQQLQLRDTLTDRNDVLYMQVFVEEVGAWMDSMDPLKHVSIIFLVLEAADKKKFSQILPYHALKEPMLLFSFLACGAKHLSLVNPAHSANKALEYYDSATNYLLNALQNPHRNTVTCATAAVILNVYEIMAERPLQRMNHIAGARALLKECHWNGMATGVGAACFWLNVGMEVLSCLHFNWQVAWEPDSWGVDMDFRPETAPHREDLWVHRILYIVGKINNFRASIPNDGNHPIHGPMSLENRYDEYKNLRALADTWSVCIPGTMRPLTYLHAYQTRNNSAFPEIWMANNRICIVARMFYHTAMVLLAQIHPLIRTEDDEELKQQQRYHSLQICGIAAHCHDRSETTINFSLLHADVKVVGVSQACPSALLRLPANVWTPSANRKKY